METAINFKDLFFSSNILSAENRLSLRLFIIAFAPEAGRWLLYLSHRPIIYSLTINCSESSVAGSSLQLIVLFSYSLFIGFSIEELLKNLTCD